MNVVGAVTVNTHSHPAEDQPPEAGGLRLIASLSTTLPSGQQPAGEGQCMVLQALGGNNQGRTRTTKVEAPEPMLETAEPWQGEDSVA